MLTVHYGPFQPELEEAFIAHLRRSAVEGSLVVATPSRRLSDRLERLATVEHGLTLLDVHFHTFYSLAQIIVPEDLGGRRLVPDPVFHDRLIDILLAERPRLAGVFGGEGRPLGLAGALRSSIRDLLDAGISTSALGEDFARDLLADEAARCGLEALLELARAYEEKLAELGIMAPSGLVRLAAEGAAQSPALNRFREVFYYGFYDLTGLQLDFFEAVAACRPTRLFFPYQRPHPAFRFADDFFEQKLMGHAVEKLRADAAEGSLRPGVALRVINASGARDEVWAAAKEILRLVEEEGFSYEEIGVVARVLEPYRGVLEQVFAQNAVPLDLACGRPLLRHPLAKSAFNLLSLRRRDFQASTLEDLFCSPYYNRIEKGPNPVYHWRLIIRRLGIHGGWLQWRGKLEGKTEQDLELWPQRVLEGDEGYLIPREDLKGLWSLVVGLEKALGDESEPTWAGKSARARALLEEYLRLPEDAQAEEKEVWRAVLAGVDSLGVFDALGCSCSWPDFLQALEEKLRGAVLDGATGRRGVRALSAMDARGESFRCLFLIGLKDKLFPRQVLEDPVLRDGVRAALRHPAGYWIAQKAAGHEEERLLFHLLAGSARERLYCLYPRSDEDGKAEVPSPYLRQLCRAAGGRLEDPAFNSHVPRQPAAKLEALDPFLASPKEVCLRSALEGRTAGEYLSLIGADGVLLDGALSRQEAFNAWGPAGNLDGLVGSPEDFLKDLRRKGLSPSALDSLGRCPFQFFADRLLGLGEAEEASEKGQFAPWTRGKIYHAVLERFYGRLNELGWPRDYDGHLRSAIESVFRDYDWRAMGVYPVLWLSAKEAMSFHLERFVAWDMAEMAAEGFRPAWLEKRLQGPLPIEPPAALRGLTARGVVDRVDRDEKGGRFRVVDYKTRWRRKGKLSELVLSGELHQLPLYAELSGSALGLGWSFAGAHLFLLEDSPETTGLERSRDYTAQDWEKDRRAFYENVSVLVLRIAQGRFPIRPDEGEFGHCSRCDFSGLCRKGHGPSRRRAQSA